MTETAAGVPAPRADATNGSVVAGRTGQRTGFGGEVGFEPAGFEPAGFEAGGYDGGGYGVGRDGDLDPPAHGGDAGGAVGRVAAASERIASHVVDRVRNNAELSADRGTTTIANEVVEKIVGIAAHAVVGVHDLGGDVARTLAAVRERVGLGDADADLDRGVSVRLDGRRAVIKVVLVIEFGHPVYEVADQVRVNVIGAVEAMLGLEVTAVDIVIDDIHVDEERLAAAAAAAQR